MKCSKCGSDFPNDVNFCPYCGEQIWKCNTERGAGDGDTEKLTSSLVKLLGTALGVSVLLNLKFLLGKDRNWSGEETKGFEDILKAIRSFGTDQNAAERKAAEEEAEEAIDRAVREAEEVCKEVGNSVEEAVKSFTSGLEEPIADLKKSVEETAAEIERSFNEIMAEAEKALSEEASDESAEETEEASADEPEEEPSDLDKGVAIEIEEEPEEGITVISFLEEPETKSESDEEEDSEEDEDDDDLDDEESDEDEEDIDDDLDDESEEDDDDLDDEDEDDESDEEDDLEDDESEEDESEEEDIEDESDEDDDDIEEEEDVDDESDEDEDDDESEDEDDEEEIEKAAEADEAKEETKRANPFAFLFNPFRKAEKEPEKEAEPEEPVKSDESVEIKIDFGDEPEAAEADSLSVAFGETEPEKPAFDSVEIEKEDFAEAAEPEIPIEGFDEEDTGAPVSIEIDEPELPEDEEEPSLPEEPVEPGETSHLIDIDFGDEEPALPEDSEEAADFTDNEEPEEAEEPEFTEDMEEPEQPEEPEEPEDLAESEDAPANNVDELLSNWSFAPEAKAAEPAEDDMFRGEGNADKFGSFVEAPLDEYVMTVPEEAESEEAETAEEAPAEETADGGLSLEDILSEGAPQQTPDAEDFLFNSLFDDRTDDYPHRKQSPLYADAPTAADYESVKMDAEEPISLDTIEEEVSEEPAEDDLKINIHSEDYDVDEDEEEFFGHDEPSGTNEETFDIDEHLMNLRKEAEDPAPQDNAAAAAYSLADLIVSGYEDEPDEEDTPIDF